jgi:DNA-binding LytR/AlgR family response regulator
MTISCAIIDDEPLAAGLLESYAKKTPFLELIGTYNSAIMAMKDLRDNPAQLLLLDIQMPELSGIEFAKILPKETRIIFTTAFPQYAVEGYKVDALDYLLKPVSYEDFLKSTGKALDWFSVVQRQDAYRRDRFMFVKTDYKLQRVNLDDILYIEGLKDYVRFYLKDGQRIMSLMSMKKLEEYLPKPEFLRTHRSYIVHMSETPLVDRFRIVFGE